MGHSHRHSQPTAAISSDQRYQLAHRVTVVGAVINLLLAGGKMVAGWFGNSQALIADGIHSLSDLISDGVVLVGARHGSREADADHPYGHARIETAATVLVGLLLLLVAIGIAWDATSRLFDPAALLLPGVLALSAAIVSVLLKEALYHYTLRVARQIGSKLLRANAWHHRSDAVSSIVVVVGVIGTMAGLNYLDAIAAIAVAVMIGKIGWELTASAIQELVDQGLAAERVAAIRSTILAVDGVDELHMLRTRRMGEEALVDVHILVDPRLSVSEGHYLSERVRSRVVQEIDEVTDVLVHIDPEDDEAVRPSIELPDRATLLKQLQPCWEAAGIAAQISGITLHYLDGELELEVRLPLDAAADAARLRELAETIQSAAADIAPLRRVTLCCCIAL